MAKTIPFPTRPKAAPEETMEFQKAPDQSDLIQETPEVTAGIETTPRVSRLKQSKPEETKPKEETPEESPGKETIPAPSAPKDTTPSTLEEDNVVYVNDIPIEIKPTKLKYFRNGTVSCYGYLKAIPLTEFLTYEKGVLNPTKDADQLLFDFLVAAFNDATFVRDNYDEMTAETVEKVIKIFGRLNNIDEKEEAARKNRQAQGNR